VRFIRKKKKVGRPPDPTSLLMCHKKIFYLKAELSDRGIHVTRIDLSELAKLCKEILELSSINLGYKWANFLRRDLRKQYRD